MNSLVEYKIPVSGLKDGENQFKFKVGHEFFSHFPDSEIRIGKLKVIVDIDKKPQLLHLQFKIWGTINVQCDRCLGYFSVPLKFKERLTVKFAQETSDLTNIYDAMTLSYQENELDLAPHIYEYIALRVPVRRVHPKDVTGKRMCDESMIELINKHKVTEDKKVDPRWEKLQSVYN